MPPAHHALTLRLPPATDAAALAAALTEAAELWWPGDRRRPRLWTETVPAPAASAPAGRRREAEARRPPAPGHRLRAVLLRYAEADGSPGPGPDLVLTADAAALDARSLRLVGRVLCGGGPGPGAVTPVEGPLAPDLRLDAATRRLAGALAVTAGRYTGAVSVRVAVPVPARGRPPCALGALDGYAVLTADLSPGRTVADLLATGPTAPAEGEDPPALELVAQDGTGRPVLPADPDALPVPAVHVERICRALAHAPPTMPLGRLDPLSERESAALLTAGATRPAPPSPASTRRSPRGSPRTPTPPPSPAAPPPSPTPDSTPAPRSSRTGCTPGASGPAISSGSACPARRTWWRRCSAS